MLEVLLVMAFLGLMGGLTSIALGGLQTGNALRDAATLTVDGLRRAQAQATSGHFGDRWGVHFSAVDGCALPAAAFQIFRGTAFTSATDTHETIALPAGARITAVAVGGGCDAEFSRYEGSATSTGTVTLSNDLGETRTVTIHPYGRVTSP